MLKTKRTLEIVRSTLTGDKNHGLRWLSDLFRVAKLNLGAH